jgi:phospholipid-binding lipoprotein MlaA
MQTQGMRILSIVVVTALTLQWLPQAAIADSGAQDLSPGRGSGGVEEVGLVDDEFGDGESAPLEVSDPIERVNRGVFWFNDTLDVYLLEPVAKGYDALVPDIIQEDLGHFFDTLRFPIYLFSDLIALDGERAWLDTARFAVNTTIGFLGFFDVAHDYGLERRATDTGVAFGRLGIPEGPYIVLPIIGPSNFRDSVGEVFNFFLDPLAAVQFSEMTWRTKAVISTGGGTARVINRRSQMIPNVRSAKEASLDYYLFVQSAYTQYRRGLVAGEESADRALFDTRIDD